MATADIDKARERIDSRLYEEYHGGEGVEENRDHVVDFEFFDDAAGDYCLGVPGEDHADSLEKSKARCRELHGLITELFEHRALTASYTGNRINTAPSMMLMGIGQHIYDNLVANGFYWDESTQTLRMRV